MKKNLVCPDCGTNGQLVKAGRNRSGTQRYQCKCGRIYTPNRKRAPAPELAHLTAALMYKAGFSLKEIASILSISIQAASVWAQRYEDHVHVTLNNSLYELNFFQQLAKRHRSDK